ncbi:MAG: class C sortase [Defluviitaleaceae bacterium]|nr:class C sortase [Defluviitaleaceae bacterium]
MSSAKMGLFISELRKSKQMTQKELAEKLNVTDKAVSKWERGLSYPDISLLMPLADTLGVTAGELLNSEISIGTSTNEVKTIVDNVLIYADEAIKLKARSTRRRAALAVLGGCIILWCLIMIPLFIWPSIARTYNASIMRRVIYEQQAAVALLGQDIIDEHFRRAEEHNAALRELSPTAPLMVAHMATVAEDYYNILNVNGIMGWLEIPVIDVNFLPIFHGTSSLALDRGAGHMEGTAFPIGGYGNHPVIVAYGGAALERMLRGLEHNVNIGDIFYITILGQRLVYQVYEIIIISPHEVEKLRIIPDADVVTLMTCVPYGINSHRLLVRGTRVEYSNSTLNRPLLSP